MHSRLKAVIHFSPDGRRWRPTFVWLESETMRIMRLREFRDKVYVALKHALRPVVDRLVSTETHS
jgi:hypothetical protein